jgi:SagB-type dehydrogenase family enzyme
MAGGEQSVLEGTSHEDLARRLELLSEYECAQLLRLFDEVTVGQRFWEDGISDLYNERVKFRATARDDGTGAPIPAAPETEGGGIFAPIPIIKSVTALERLVLPERRPLERPLGEALLRRRSRREYTSVPISRQQLSDLLYYSAGATGSTNGYGYDALPLRTFPSSGGLGVPELYVSVQAVEDVAPGLYHYHPIDHALELLRRGQQGDLLRIACLGQSHLETAAVVVLVSGCFARLRWKYGERAYRYMCIDVGYLGQSLYLVGEALGLGVCAVAGFMDDAIERFLDVDGRDEIPLLLTTFGYLG